MTFDEVRYLDDAALRRLLAGPDAVERLWAIWALALGQGAQVVETHAAGEPSVGVRRQLCIVLAGGELDLFVAMARHDPSNEVRATAAQLIVRLAAGGRLPWSLAHERFGDPSALARVAALREIPAEIPPEVKAAVLEATKDPELDVRLEAIEALGRVSPIDAVEACVSRLQVAGEAEAAALLSRWAESTKPATIHSALRGRSLDIRLIAIRHLARCWADDADLALDPDRTVRDAVRDSFIGTVSDVPIDVLAQWIEDGPTSRTGHFAGATDRRWYAELSQADWRLLLSSCHRRLTIVESALAGAKLEPDDEAYWESEHPLVREHGDLAHLIIMFGG